MVNIYVELLCNQYIIEKNVVKSNRIDIKRKKGVTDINELMGSTLTFYHSCCAVISADTSAGRIKLFSEPLTIGNDFSKSTIFPVWLALLENFTDLKPVRKYEQTTNTWYKKQ